jgi:hypothetical protein
MLSSFWGELPPDSCHVDVCPAYYVKIQEILMRALLSRVLLATGLTLVIVAPVALASTTPLADDACCPGGGCCDPGCPFCHHAAK